MKAQIAIRQMRIKLGLTQKETADVMGPNYNKQKIADYETGRARVPGDLVLQLQALLAEREVAR